MKPASRSRLTAGPLHAPGRPDPGPRIRVPADQPRRPRAASGAGQGRAGGGGACAREPDGGGGAEGAARHADGGGPRASGAGAVSYAEYLRLCCDATGADAGPSVARALDESGCVIVLGKTVFLRPDMVVKAIERAIPVRHALPVDENNPAREELKAMEAQKTEVDRTAAWQVRRELWCSLAYLVVQTAGFMRLTFWELSWDVMEPICFYVTSMYFMASYAFFLRTKKEPSFEGFFESRFAAKQKRLMQARDFDARRYDELRRACGLAPALQPPSHQQENGHCRSYCHCH